MKKILFAHQSSIPHYRVPLCNSIHKQMADDWEFEVVYDSAEVGKKIIFKESLNKSGFKFKTLDCKSFHIKMGDSHITIQDVVLKSSIYDLLIVEQAFNNISYPISQFRKLLGKKVALWGHVRHMSATDPTFTKRILEWIKLKLLKLSDKFYTYTIGIALYLQINCFLITNSLFDLCIDIFYKEQSC